MEAGAAYGIRPAGMLALDVARLEAGLILIEVDYTSARHALNPEQNYSPFELGLGRLVSFDKGDFVGRLALQREQAAGGPPRRLVGLQLDWDGIEELYDAQGLPPAISPRSTARRSRSSPGGRQVGKVTSHGWSPILKQAIALASVPPRYEPLGTRLEVEWTVEGRRGRVAATRRAAALPRPGAQARLSIRRRSLRRHCARRRQAALKSSCKARFATAGVPATPPRRTCGACPSSSCRVPTAVPSRASRLECPTSGVACLPRSDLLANGYDGYNRSPPSDPLFPGSRRLPAGRGRRFRPGGARAVALHRLRRAGGTGPDRRLPGGAAALVEPRASRISPFAPSPC